MNEYLSREAVFQVVHGIARGIADRDIEALKAKDMKTLYMIRGAKEILDSVDTDLCYIPVADVQPVKHGRWIITDDVEHFIAVCSECGRTEDSRCIKDMPYCHCGARMESAKGGDVKCPKSE